MKRITREAVIQFAGIVLFLLLSYQLVGAKNENADLRAEIARGTQPFVFGGPLPAVALRGDGSSRVTLPRICAERAPVVAVFWSNKCGACRQLKPLLAEVGRRRRDVRIVLVGADGELPHADFDIGRGVRMVASPREVSTLHHIKQTPTLVASDDVCRITAAASTLVASESLLRTLLSNAPN